MIIRQQSVRSVPLPLGGPTGTSLTPSTAQSSAVIYSLVETAKANKLKIYEYLKHLLTEIPKHMEATSLDFLEDLLPWSKNLPEECRKKI